MFAQNKLDPDDFFEALFDARFTGNDMFAQLGKISLSIDLQIVKIKLNICHAKYLFCRQVSL